MIYCFKWLRESTPRLLSLYIFIYVVIPLFPHWALFSSRPFPFNPLQVCACPHTSTWWIRGTFQIFELGSIWSLDIHWIVSLLYHIFNHKFYYFCSLVGLYISIIYYVMCGLYAFNLVSDWVSYWGIIEIIFINLYINVFLGMG